MVLNIYGSEELRLLAEKSGAQDLMRDFGLSSHQQSQDSFYKEYKEEMVTGFVGDNSPVPVFSICAFLCTNDLLFNIIVTFLRQSNTFFNEIRTNPYETRPRIVFNSLFDTLMCVMPPVVFISDYHNGLMYHGAVFGLIAAIFVTHSVLGYK